MSSISNMGSAYSNSVNGSNNLGALRQLCTYVLSYDFFYNNPERVECR